MTRRLRQLQRAGLDVRQSVNEQRLKPDVASEPLHMACEPQGLR